MPDYYMINIIHKGIKWELPVPFGEHNITLEDIHNVLCKQFPLIAPPLALFDPESGVICPLSLIIKAPQYLTKNYALLLNPEKVFNSCDDVKQRENSQSINDDGNESEEDIVENDIVLEDYDEDEDEEEEDTTSMLNFTRERVVTVEALSKVINFNDMTINMMKDLWNEYSVNEVMDRNIFYNAFSSILKLDESISSQDAANNILNALFWSMDANEDGEIDWNEFMSFVFLVCPGSDLSVELLELFQSYDTNNDGFISKEEMMTYAQSFFTKLFTADPRMQQTLSNLTPDELAYNVTEKCFDEADLNNDLHISFIEFKYWCTCPSDVEFLRVVSETDKSANINENTSNEANIKSHEAQGIRPQTRRNDANPQYLEC